MSIWARKSDYKAADMEAGAGKAPREKKLKGKIIRSTKMRTPKRQRGSFAWFAYCFIPSA